LLQWLKNVLLLYFFTQKSKKGKNRITEYTKNKIHSKSSRGWRPTPLDSAYFWSCIFILRHFLKKSDTPYEKGMFVVDIHFPLHYPLAKPIVKFVTNIYHLNFKADMPIANFGQDWKHHFTIVDGMFLVLRI